MYVIRADMEILCSNEVRTMEEEYYKKFGEWFIHFNYVDFPGIKGEQRPAEMYREALREALKKDEPTHIESHRYDIIDH